MKFKKPYEKQPRVKSQFTGPTRTKQAFKKECDINQIMSRFHQTGLVSHVAHHQGDYSDLSDAPTYYDAMLKITAADQSFNSLPSDMRKYFNNSPHEFLTFVSDPNNNAAMVEMGLIPDNAPSPPTSSSTTESLPVEDTDIPAASE